MFTLFKNKNLINLENFESSYILNIKSYTSLNKDKVPLIIERKSKIKLKQIIEGSRIINTYFLTETEENSNDENFNKFFKKLSFLSFITEELKIERSLRGQILTLLNIDQIEKKWKNWKEKKLYEFLPILKDQENFVISFEKGLLYLKDNIKNELDYILLFPEIYQFKDYISTAREFTSLYIFDSCLIKGAEIKYKFYISDILQKEFSPNINIHLKSEITNKQELTILLKSLENKYNGITDYKFFEDLFYNIDKSTGKITYAKLELTENISEGHEYKYLIDFYPLETSINSETEKIYKTYKGKDFTLKEWEKFEQKQFDDFVNNNLINKDHDLFNNEK